MKCLYCGKEIAGSALTQEKEHQWHEKCIKKFFGTTTMPKLDISEESLERLANETVNKGLTVPGVQKKLSLHLSMDAESRLTIVDYPTGYILKPQTEEYNMLPEHESLAMNLAKMAGIQTVDNALIKNNGTYAYITKRVDRSFDKKGHVKMYAMEDFCQLSERLTLDKYKGSYEKCAKIIEMYSIRPGIDLAELFIRVLFSFVIGNSDMHLKNFSLIEDEPNSRRYYLSPAYDMLSVNVVMPEDKEQLALTLNGKKSRFKKEDFVTFAQKCNINGTATDKIIKKICSLEYDFHKACDESYLPESTKAEVKALISERIEIIK